jgi:hypothetical protein
MRSLLHAVRHDERDHVPMEADPLVRDRVLETFRVQHRPSQWGIWLNSVKAVLWPEQASAFWKPALAFGSLAVVVTVAVIGLRTLNDTEANAVAEVRQEEAEPAKPAAPASEERTQEEVPPAPASPGATTADAVTLDREADKNESVEATDQPAIAQEAPAAVAEAAAEGKYFNDFDLAEKRIAKKEGEAASMMDSMTRSTPPVSGHVVTEAELATNMSVANATGTVSKDVMLKAKKARKQQDGSDDGGAMASTDATALVGLLQAAW